MSALTFELTELCQDILGFVEHGDYSNGNEVFGCDEGRVRAGECLDLYRKRFEALKKQSEVKVTYRGWPGHLCMGSRCVFHLNTLVELGEVRVVVSTVGNLRTGKCDEPEDIGGYGRYYETRVFRACARDVDKRWDMRADCVSAIIYLSDHNDQEAQDMHEATVQEITSRVLSGELK